MEEALQRLREAGMPAEKEQEARAALRRAFDRVRWWQETKPISPDTADAVQRELDAFCGAIRELKEQLDRLDRMSSEAHWAIEKTLPPDLQLHSAATLEDARRATEEHLLPFIGAADYWRKNKGKLHPDFGRGPKQRTWAYDFAGSLACLFHWATEEEPTFSSSGSNAKPSNFKLFADAAFHAAPGSDLPEAPERYIKEALKVWRAHYSGHN